VAQWSKTLHHSDSCATRDPGSSLGSVAVGRRAIGPASSGLGKGLAGWDVLVPSRSSNSCWRPCACTLTRSPGVWCFLRHIGEAGFRVKYALCQIRRAAWLGRVSEDARLSNYVSPESVRELQGCDKTMILERKRGKINI
jgi:hypothetical protein